jgi:competence protein ComEC
MPLLWLSLLFLVGILLGANFSLPTSIWLFLAAATLVVWLLWLALKRSDDRLAKDWSDLAQSPIYLKISRLIPTFPLSFPLLLLALLIGAARYQSAQPVIEPDFIAWYNDMDGEVTVEGVLVKPPDLRDSYTNLRVKVDQLRFAQNLPFIAVDGLVLVKVPPGEMYHYGDRLRLHGRLETPPVDEDFSYRDYLALKGVYAYMGRAYATPVGENQGNPVLKAIYAIKERALTVVYQIYPDPEASLLAGILLGVEKGIPERVQEDFKKTGTAHIIAISGFNITIIAGLFVVVFTRLLGPLKGAAVAFMGIVAYTVLVGGDAAVVRAAIMGGLALLARQVGRRQEGLTSLGVSAAVMALFNPHIPWDVCFQLSFMATLGLVLYAEPFSRAFIEFSNRYLSSEAVQRLVGPVGEYFLYTLAAQLTTLPVTAYHFKRLSLVSLIANPLILPAQPAVMILGGIGVISGLIYLPLGQLAASLAWPFVVYTVRVVEFFGRFDWGVWNMGNFSLLWVVLFYGALIMVTFKDRLFRSVAVPLRPALMLSIIGVLTVLVWQQALRTPDGLLHMTLLDVSSASQSGDAILIQTPRGRYLLINGGPSTRALSDSLGRRMPVFHRKLDSLLVGSVREEHIAALPSIIERYSPSEVIWAGREQASRSAYYLHEGLVESGIPITTAESGQVLDLAEGAKLWVLAAGSRGAVYLLEWDRFRALLPIGPGYDDFERFGYGRDLGQVTVLLLADSGYAPTNPPAWIDNLRPQLVLLSVAGGDALELPSPETLEALQGYSLLRTDINGWIHLSTDGEQMWVEVER